MVEPLSFLVVELSTSLRAVRNIESLYEFIERENLLFGARIPSEKCEEIDHCLWEISALAVSRAYFSSLRVMPFQWEYRESETVAITLGELSLTFRLEQEREVSKLRHSVSPSESLIEKHVERRTWEPFLTTDDVRDLHEVVVHDIGEMVGRELVSALVEHLVVEDVGLDAHLAADEVIDEHFLARIDKETHYILLAVSDELVHLFLAEAEGIAHLKASLCVVLEVLYLAALGLELFRSVECDVRFACINKLLDVLLVYIPTLALAVRTMFASEAYTFIKLDAEPFE